MGVQTDPPWHSLLEARNGSEVALASIGLKHAFRVGTTSIFKWKSRAAATQVRVCSDIPRWRGHLLETPTVVVQGTVAGAGNDGEESVTSRRYQCRVLPRAPSSNYVTTLMPSSGELRRRWLLKRNTVRLPVGPVIEFPVPEAMSTLKWRHRH